MRLWWVVLCAACALLWTGCLPYEDEASCDCPDGWICVDGVCTQPTDNPILDDGTCDPACGDGFVCRMSACVPSGGDEREHSSSGNSWTFLVYMVADNNLEPAGVDDLNEMIAVGSTSSVNIVVQADRAEGYSFDGVGGVSDWVSTKRLVARPGQVEEVADLGELNMGDPRVLADFIEWGVKTYPADRTALIFWDHGGAWPGFGGDDSTPDHDLLTLAELRQGMAEGMQRAGLEQFALIGFDACLMATYETIQVMRPFGEYMLASEELEPGHGWDYRSLQVLTNDPSASPVALGEALIDGFFAQAQEAGTGNELTLSLVDLYNLSPLDRALAGLADALEPAMAEKAATLGQQRYQSLGFGRNPDPSQDTHMVDIGDLVRNVATADGSLSSVREMLDAALEKAVVRYRNGPVTARASGVAIYFPPARAYYDTRYDELPEVAVWRRVLDGYYSAGGQLAAGAQVRFTNPNNVGELGFEQNQLILAGQLAAESIPSVAQITLRYGVLDDAAGLVYLVGDASGGLDASGVAYGAWDTSVLVMMQDGVSGYAYLSVQVEGEYLRATIPLVYVSPAQGEQVALLSYVLDGSGNVLQSTYYLVTEGGFGELYPEPGSAIYPMVQVADGSSVSWQPTSDTGIDPSREIQFDVEFFEAGTSVYLELDAYDFAGNADYVYNTGVL